MSFASFGLVRLALALAAACAAPAAAGEGPTWQPSEGASWIGQKAPAWTGLEWIAGGPLSLAALEGKTLLLRFWTSDCELCRASAPALNHLYSTYGDAGLVVVGIHHPKDRRSRSLAYVRERAADLGFRFPVAQDVKWSTVRAYGVGSTFTTFTSVSFLIDRSGVIRFVHDGGEFHEGGGPRHAECHAAYAALETSVREALTPANSPGKPAQGTADSAGPARRSRR